MGFLKKIYNILFRTLSGKFSLYILALVLLTTFALSYFAYNRERDILAQNTFKLIRSQRILLENLRDEITSREENYAIKSTEKKGTIILNNTSRQLGTAIENYDFTSVSNLINSLILDEDIVYVILVNDKLTPLNYRLSKKFYSQKYGSKLINESGKFIGYISYSENKKKFKDKYSKFLSNQKQLHKKRIQLNELNIPVYDFAIPINSGGIKFGFLRVGFSLKKMEETIAKIKKEASLKTSEAVRKVKDESKMEEAQKLKQAFEETLITGMIFIGLGLFISIFLSKRISKPISKLADIMTQASLGDLKVKANIKTRDELENLGENFNKMISNIAELVRQIRSNSKVINEVSNTLASSAYQSSTAIDSISANVQEINFGAKNNVNIVSSTKYRTERLGQNAKKINFLINDALKSSLKMQNTANEGNKVVETMVYTILSIKDEVNSTSDIIDSLYKAAANIDKIVKTISNITIKTNNLAYNVSISAVKSGKQVKEIAEIGKQVRILAAESSKSVEEIDNLVHGIQNKINNAYTAIKNTVKSTDSGVIMAKDAGGKLNNIVVSGKDLQNFITTITPLIKNQTEATEVIRDSIEEVAVTSEQTSKGTELASQYLTEQSKTTDYVAKIAQELKSSAETLRKDMDKFIVN